MTATEAREITDVVAQVQDWPAPMRLALAQRILETLEQPALAESKAPRGPSAAEVAAMFRTDKQTPDDATVKQWIDEHRMEKYSK